MINKIKILIILICSVFVFSFPSPKLTYAFTDCYCTQRAPTDPDYDICPESEWCLSCPYDRSSQFGDMNSCTHATSCTCSGGQVALPDAPVVAGYLRDYWGNPLGGVEIDWTNIAGEVRKRWTNASGPYIGGYYYASWVNLADGGTPYADYQPMIDMRHQEHCPGDPSDSCHYPTPPWLASVEYLDAFSVAKNPHKITAVLPAGWYGAMIPRENINLVYPNNTDHTIPQILDLVYKPPPTASINGPTSGYVGQQTSDFAATGNGPGMGHVQIWRARTNSTLSDPNSWTKIGETGCNGGSQCGLDSVYFTPQDAGDYYIVVNAFADYSSPSTWCSGNPASGAYADCNAGYSFPDYILFTANLTPGEGVWCGWNSCSANCNGGTQSNSCNCPAPTNGGLQCLKNDGTRGLTDTQACNTQCCPVDGVCSGWSGWSCSGNSTIRTRTYTAPICGGNNVACSPLIETVSCDDGNPCTTDSCNAGVCGSSGNNPVNGTWGPPYGICSTTCNPGQQTMTCNGASCGGTCPLPIPHYQACNDQPNQACPAFLRTTGGDVHANQP